MTQLHTVLPVSFFPQLSSRHISILDTDNQSHAQLIIIVMQWIFIHK